MRFERLGSAESITWIDDFTEDFYEVIRGHQLITEEPQLPEMLIDCLEINGVVLDTHHLTK